MMVNSDIRKIDLHTHILPRDLPDFSKKFGYDGFVRLEHHRPCGARMMIGDQCFREITSNCWDEELRLKECDESQVQVQVLSTIPVLFSYWAKPRDGLALSQYLNDHLASVVAKHPKRFVALGTLPLQDPDLAARELERVVNDLGFPGVEIGSHVNGWNLDEPALFPVFEHAARLGACVFVHPWDMMAKDRMERYFLRWLVGMPAETTLAICSLILGGVLERLPKLRVCFAHGGGALPGTLGRIEHGFHARPDLCTVATKTSPAAQLRRIFVDSLTHDADVLRLLLKQFGAERIALGSDYPFPLGERTPGELIASMPDLTKPVKQRLYYQTALEFLNLKEEHFD